MKIFEFYWKDADATDWVYAHDKEDAEDFYLGFTQCGDLDGCIIEETPEEEWDNHDILDIDNLDDEGNYKVFQTFKDYAKENMMTDIIATTEF